jgi:hypothetical protein
LSFIQPYRRTKLYPFQENGRNEVIMLSEIIQTEKNQYYTHSDISGRERERKREIERKGEKERE